MYEHAVAGHFCLVIQKYYYNMDQHYVSDLLSALHSTLGCLWPGCDIMQGGEPSAGSGPNKTHRRVITVSGRKLDC